MLKKRKIQKRIINKITEGGIILGIVIILNVISNIYITKIFPEGAAINMSFVFIMALIYRHGIWFGSSINLLGVTIVHVVLNPGTMFPPISYYSWWGIVISILLDYIGSSFIAILMSYYLVALIRRKNNNLIKGILFIILRNIFGFIFSFISGILVWGIYAPNNYGVYLYSLIYNITVSGGECCVAILLFIPLVKRMPKLFTKINKNTQGIY